MKKQPPPTTVDDYFAACVPKVQSILQRIRTIVRKAAPDAVEKISYGMPAFFHDGALIYYAAFKNHIGMFPPVKGDKELQKDLARHRGPKGNLHFPLDERMPYGLITRVVKCRVREHREHLAAKAAAKKRKK
jgi:uncharacterized protein YdhG (YjbR/CyaY superfamily)